MVERNGVMRLCLLYLGLFIWAIDWHSVVWAAWDSIAW